MFLLCTHSAKVWDKDAHELQGGEHGLYQSMRYLNKEEKPQSWKRPQSLKYRAEQ